MNQNKFRNYLSALIFVMATFAITTVVQAQTASSVFSQISGQISAVNNVAKSVTISYLQASAMIYCIQEPCPPLATSRNPDTITQNQVLVFNGMGKVIDDITTLKVGDGVIVYLKQNVPYAVKDTNMLTPGCDPVTGVCSSTVTPPPGVVSGQPPTASGTPGETGGQPPAESCVQLQTYPPQTICPEDIVTGLGMGTRSGEVLELQIKLSSMGYFPSATEPTGYFGPVTKQAVVEYQAASGLPQTGYVGEMTRSALGY